MTIPYEKILRAANLAHKERLKNVSKKILVTDSKENKGLVSKKNNSKETFEKINGSLTELHFAILDRNEELKSNIDTGVA
tara:strand:+ start:2665 stop:2904 length:240 start_codon:yes stop_codon:yes gene_type:complete